MNNVQLACRICAAPTREVARKFGRYSGEMYFLRHCPDCRFSFVANPWTDFARIYDEAYYQGRGADPLVNYTYELDCPDRAIRRYEWGGILKSIRSLTKIDVKTRWLDFGCGNGGLVRHVREVAGCDVVGFEEGWIRERAAERGIPILNQADLRGSAEAFDIVTAIEVLEHVTDPLSVLTEIRRFLRPGGLFFFTTGNARPFRNRLLRWQYVIPEIHVSFFEPETLARALRATGFDPQYQRFLPGFDDIIRFKVLKSLRVRQTSPLEQALPWGILSRVIDRRLGVSDHPIGRVKGIYQNGGT